MSESGTGGGVQGTADEAGRLSIAYSPCPNDTFVFDAVAHGRVPGAPALDVTFANTPGVSEAVDPQPGATGQANPQPDRHRSMRDHDSVEPVPGKNR